VHNIHDHYSSTSTQTQKNKHHNHHDDNHHQIHNSGDTKSTTATQETVGQNSANRNTRARCFSNEQGHSSFIIILIQETSILLLAGIIDRE